MEGLARAPWDTGDCPAGVQRAWARRQREGGRECSRSRWLGTEMLICGEGTWSPSRELVPMDISGPERVFVASQPRGCSRRAVAGCAWRVWAGESWLGTRVPGPECSQIGPPPCRHQSTGDPPVIGRWLYVCAGGICSPRSSACRMQVPNPEAFCVPPQGISVATGEGPFPVVDHMSTTPGQGRPQGSLKTHHPICLPLFPIRPPSCGRSWPW